MARSRKWRDTDKRRVLMFTPGHAETGGAARRSRIIASALAARGWEVRVVTRAGISRRFALVRRPNLLVLEVPGFRRPVLGALLFLSVGIPVGIVWGARASVIVAIHLASPTTAAAVCAKVLRRPFLALATTSGSLSEVTHLLKGRMGRLRQLLVRDAAFLAGQTDTAAVELARLARPGGVVVLPNPVETVVAPPLTGARRAAYTGRLSEEKDLSRLLEAWAVIAGRHPDAVLTLAGEGGHYRSVEARLHRLVREDPLLAHSVRFTGWVADVGSILAAADIYVFPSMSEGMSNALLEACAWGRVVVASDIPSNRAVLGADYPLLFTAGDTEGLIDALKRAMEDHDVRAAAVALLARRVQAHSVDAFATRLEELMTLAADGATTRDGQLASST